MPNWCRNVLTVRGDKDTINNFINMVSLSEEEQKVRGQRCDILSKLYPCPQELTDTVSGWSADEAVQAEREKQYEANIAKYGYKDWYDWQVANWGTKWGDDGTYISDRTDNEVIFHMDTAWEPPLTGIAHVATLFPTLRFALSYDESGMGFFGFATFSNNGEVSDKHREYDSIDGYTDLCEKMNGDDDDYYEAFDKLSELVFEAQDKLESESGFYDLDKV